ncbi:2Fe-2S iron-sulfur cluster-binding protein [Halobaculum sp. EA56]|uniref:2Fe-2S iron-sulfur cluster-binding protein n=1 Tax=Halobaculum sp. EA56 TaxID=3421648 RepID=UPI003EBC1A62
MPHDLVLRWDDGREETVEAGSDESVFAAAERAGVGLPIGCRTGACATCTGQLLSGAVSHRRPPRALDRDRLDEGYVLLCIAEPRADCVLRVGSAVARELTSNPWK